MELENLKQLLVSGNTEQAAQELERFLALEISPQQQGEALVFLATAYMEVQNTANSEYLKLLRQAIKELKDLQKEENGLNDVINLAKVRKQLG